MNILDSTQILKGHIVYTDTPSSFEIYKDSFIVSVNGVIEDIYTVLPTKYANLSFIDYGDSIIIPGFYDLHNHAGQYLQCGTGMNKQLLEWLNDYTYKLESDLADTEYATKVYAQFTKDLLRYGTLGGACTFATTSKDSTECLF